jgi:hypothetical protein
LIRHQQDLSTIRSVNPDGAFTECGFQRVAALALDIGPGDQPLPDLYGIEIGVGCTNEHTRPVARPRPDPDKIKLAFDRRNENAPA